MGGHTYDAEVSAHWNVVPQWRLDASWSYLRMDLALDDGSLGNSALPGTHEGLAPQNFLELDTAVRFVDDLPTLGYSSYTILDLGVGWRPSEHLELALVGQNLLDDPHPEQAFVFSSSGVATEVERSVYVKLGWNF